MKRMVLLVASVFLSASLNAKDSFGPYDAEVLRVIDGDTVEVLVHIWPGLQQQIKLRLDGINTPEKRGKVSQCEKEAGQKATNFTQNWLRGVTQVTVDNVALGKWAGRVLGSLRKGDQDLSKALMDAGHAKPYQGGKREPWC